MKIKFSVLAIKIITAVLVCAPALSISQSCGSCTINITSVSANSYTVGSGQVFCIDSLGKFTGTITLNGGTICNKGFFKPQNIIFNNGTVINKSIMFWKGNMVLSSDGTIENQQRAMIHFEGSLTLNGGTLKNHGIINVIQDVTNASGSFENTKVINCRALTGTNSFVQKGKINSR